MGLFDLSTASEELEDLLERERVAVRAGRFDQRDRRSVEKERLVRCVARDGAAPETLIRLRSGTQRNGELLDAMRAGIAAAQTKIKALQQPRKALQTYDACGRKQAIQMHPKPLGHRA